MSVLLGALSLGRGRAAARMTETVRIGELVEGEDELLNPIHTLQVAYSGKARIKFASSAVSNTDAGGQLVAVQKHECHLPSGTAGITPDMFGVVDSSTADAGIAGLTFRIAGRPEMGQTTAARFPIVITGEVIEEGS